MEPLQVENTNGGGFIIALIFGFKFGVIGMADFGDGLMMVPCEAEVSCG